MDLLHVVNAGRYTHPEKNRQIVPCKWISLGISGLLRQRGYYPDGTPSSQGCGPLPGVPPVKSGCFTPETAL